MQQRMHALSSQSREKSTYADDGISPCGRNDKKNASIFFNIRMQLDRLQAFRCAYCLKKMSMATALLQYEPHNFSFFCQGMIQSGKQYNFT